MSRTLTCGHSGLMKGFGADNRHCGGSNVRPVADDKTQQGLYTGGPEALLVL